MIPQEPHNIFIGGLSGVFKGITANLSKGIHNIKNLQNLKKITSRNEVTVLNWGNKEESEILIGYADQTVKIFDLDLNQFVLHKHLKNGEGEIRGLCRFNKCLMTAVASGQVKLWSETEEEEDNTFVIDTGGSLSIMRQSPSENIVIATGGKENDLKLWDLTTKKETFNAKNVRPDELQLRVPVWVSDIAYIPDSKRVAVATRYGHVRLYDPTTPTRRPVVQVTIPDQALTCIASAPRENHVLVGSGTGHMFLVDLRGKGTLLNHYKGFVGGIRQIACPQNEPYVVSVAIDRHLRIHNLNSKQLVYKEYLQSRLSTLLLKSDFSLIKKELEEITEPQSNVDMESTEKNESEEEYDALFQNMEVVTEKRSKTKSKVKRKKLV